MTRWTRTVLLGAWALAVGACDRASAAGAGRDGVARADAARPAPAPAHVDSALPLAELLRRFRAELRDTATALRGGERSREALARRFVRAVATHDTAALNAMILSRSEFAWAYYPEHPITRPPYELDAPMMWMQMRTGSETGIVRVLRTYGGRPVEYAGLACPGVPERHNGNVVWSSCAVRLRDGTGATVSVGLFGSIVERGGTYKFVSYENGL